MKFQWKRLIRFVSEDGKIQYGEPEISSIEELESLYKASKVVAKPLNGDIFDPQATLSSQAVKVKTILGPLEPKQVPLVKGIGLNYVSHSKLFLFLLPERVVSILI